LIDSGLAKGDELAEIQTLNGRALRDRHELDKALEALTASIALNPTPAAYSLRGTVYYDKGSWEQAISDYSEAIRLDATNGEAFNNRAWTYYRTGRSEKALTDADAAVRLLGKQSYVWDTRGHIHAALGNREAAISDFRAALAIDPNSADSQAGLSKLGVN
jgi:tetratricopeptide (TPR) repeat protein